MIQANELRLGNWVTYAGKPAKVYTVSDRPSVHWGEDGDDQSTEHLSPIPLSPELLEKAGFEWDNDVKGWTDGVVILYEASGHLFTPALWNHPEAIFPMATLYLHQLQNLYFALTGEELTITL